MSKKEMYFSIRNTILALLVTVIAIATANFVQWFNFWDDLTPIPTKTISKAPTTAQAQYYAPFTAAVCVDDGSLSNWTCADCVKTGPGVVIVAIHEDTYFGTKAIVNRNDRNKEIIVTWRGSVDIQNFIVDFHFEQKAPYNNSIKVHAGDWNSMNSLYEPVTTTVLKELSDYSDYGLVICGHSLGAAQASVYLFKLIEEKAFPSTTIPISLYTYGQPRSGNRAFADWYNQQSTFTVGRVTHAKDVIPHLMISGFGLVHFNTEMWITEDQKGTKFCNRDLYEDPTCSNSQGPLYNVDDHFQYYGTNLSATCHIEIPTFKSLFETVMNLNKLLA